MEQKPDDHIKRMADLLRQGNTLTDLACPVCASPLFRLKDGTLWCGKDEKKVILVKEGEEIGKPAANAAMDTLETTLLAKVQNLQGKIQQTDNVEELQKLSNALSNLLDSLEKIKRMKKS
ncbi:MAG TPA: Sjogren's syndrome/scleroderma autoantigen 1 family protein [Candidatus Bathyarchaeia archaeon]|nr:Sjogren's syndrome/scleroderma autoantigen 1 family protein [Candidatus Bathyarchaeia archaeon]